MTTRQLAAALLLTAGAAAHAQTAAPAAVSLYGLLDSGVEVLNNVGVGGGRLTRVPGQTGSLPSRIGVRGSEDLGGGLNAVFTLEQGLLPDAGAIGQGGRAFGRQAFVGLGGAWGTLTLGRQYTMLFWSLLDADILGPGIYSSSSLDSYIPNARADNAAAWRGTFGVLTLGASYSLGRDTVNAGPTPAGTNCAGESATDRQSCSERSFMVKVDPPGWGAALAVDQITGGAGAFGGLTRSGQKDTRVSANAYVTWSRTKLGGGLLRRTNDGSATAPRSDLWYLGVSYPVSELLTWDTQVFRLAYTGNSDRATLLATRLSYALSKRTVLYATAGRINNQGSLALSVSAGAPGSNPVAGGGQTGIMLGMRHSF